MTWAGSWGWLRGGVCERGVGQFPFFLYLTLSIKSKNYSLKLFSPIFLWCGAQSGWLWRTGLAFSGNPKKKQDYNRSGAKCSLFSELATVIANNHAKGKKNDDKRYLLIVKIEGYFCIPTIISIW